MIEQFSPEYKAYLLSDEAAELQKLLPREGEGVWFIDRWQNPFTETWSEWTAPHVLDEDGAGYILDYEEHEDEEFIVIPTLYQLIGVIEGAGWEWRKFVGLVFGWPLDPDAKINAEYPVSFDDKDIMLAVAKLAVRAVEAQREKLSV